MCMMVSGESVTSEWSAKEYQGRQKNIRVPSVSEQDCNPSLTLRALRRSPLILQMLCYLPKGTWPTPLGRPCSSKGGENFRSLQDFGSFSVRAGHDSLMRTLLPARLASFAEAGRIERQSLDRPLGRLGKPTFDT